MRVKTKYGETELIVDAAELIGDIADSISYILERAITEWLEDNGGMLFFNFGDESAIDFCGGASHETLRDLITDAINFHKEEENKGDGSCIPMVRESMKNTAQELRLLADYIESEIDNIVKE